MFSPACANVIAVSGVPKADSATHEPPRRELTEGAHRTDLSPPAQERELQSVEAEFGPGGNPKRAKPAAEKVAQRLENLGATAFEPARAATAGGPAPKLFEPLREPYGGVKENNLVMGTVFKRGRAIAFEIGATGTTKTGAIEGVSDGGQQRVLIGGQSFTGQLSGIGWMTEAGITHLLAAETALAGHGNLAWYANGGKAAGSFVIDFEQGVPRRGFSSSGSFLIPPEEKTAFGKSSQELGELFLKQLGFPVAAIRTWAHF